MRPLSRWSRPPKRRRPFGARCERVHEKKRGVSRRLFSLNATARLSAPSPLSAPSRRSVPASSRYPPRSPRPGRAARACRAGFAAATDRRNVPVRSPSRSLQHFTRALQIHEAHVAVAGAQDVAIRALERRAREYRLLFRALLFLDRGADRLATMASGLRRSTECRGASSPCWRRCETCRRR